MKKLSFNYTFKIERIKSFFFCSKRKESVQQWFYIQMLFIMIQAHSCLQIHTHYCNAEVVVILIHTHTPLHTLALKVCLQTNPVYCAELCCVLLCFVYIFRHFVFVLVTKYDNEYGEQNELPKKQYRYLVMKKRKKNRTEVCHIDEHNKILPTSSSSSWYSTTTANVCCYSTQQHCFTPLREFKWTDYFQKTINWIRNAI